MEIHEPPSSLLLVVAKTRGSLFILAYPLKLVTIDEIAAEQHEIFHNLLTVFSEMRSQIVSYRLDSFLYLTTQSF